MSQRRKITWALVGTTWSALGIALAGALSTPRSYCYYEGAAVPTAEIVLMVGVALALLTQVAATLLVMAGQDSTLREVLVSIVITVAAVVASVWIGSVWHQHVVSWGCG